MEDYLRATAFHPDVEYLDGKLEERHVGKWEHSRLQFLIALWFGKNESAWDVQGVTEQRMQVTLTRVRIPDVALLPPGRQPEVITDPPVLVVEILSPEDRYADLVAKAREFLAWGVRAVWIIHPENGTGEMWTQPETCMTAEVLRVSGTKIELDVAELFEALRRS